MLSTARRSTLRPAQVRRVLPDSIAAELGIEPGDSLLSINGQQPRDLIDYQFLIADEALELEILDAAGQVHQVELEKDCDDDLGIEFETALFDGLIQCNNACPFCFIDQQPPETRATLHLKDDDYRLSFLYGSYLTLTNLPPSEWDRIARLRLSPLYVSVHATEPEVRVALLKNPRAAQILDQLAWFQEHRIQIHAQVVVCPGHNDGIHLSRTLQDLAQFYLPADPDGIPTVLSAAVVPVGLTRFRPPGHELVGVDAQMARQVIQQVEGIQQQFRARLGTTFAWLADEWYLLAGQPLPPVSHYEDYPQLGNGVGSLRLFLSQFARVHLPDRLPQRIQALWIVGNAVGEAFEPIVERMNQIENLHLQLLSVASQFWGTPLTVTGLLTGSDIVRALQSIESINKTDLDVLLLPAITLKDGEQFLDDLSWRDLEQQFGIPVIRVDGGPDGLLKGIQAFQPRDPAGCPHTGETTSQKQDHPEYRLE